MRDFRFKGKISGKVYKNNYDTYSSVNFTIVDTKEIYNKATKSNKIIDVYDEFVIYNNKNNTDVYNEALKLYEGQEVEVFANDFACKKDKDGVNYTGKIKFFATHIKILLKHKIKDEPKNGVPVKISYNDDIPF